LVTYVADGIASAMAQATAAAGDAGKRDVLLVHGAYTAQRAIEAGVLDELQIHQIPVLLGGGRTREVARGPAHEVEEAVDHGGSQGTARSLGQGLQLLPGVRPRVVPPEGIGGRVGGFGVDGAIECGQAEVMPRLRQIGKLLSRVGHGIESLEPRLGAKTAGDVDLAVEKVAAYSERAGRSGAADPQPPA
jgi:hypothetical protein